MGCTYLQKWFSWITVWDVHTYGNDWVSMPRPIAHGPSLGPRRAYPWRFLGRVGRTPYRTHSLGDGSKCRRGKGLKTVCLAPRCTSVCAGIQWLVRCLLLDWYLGSQTEGILTLLSYITISISREKPTQAQDVEGRLSGAVAGEIYAKSRSTSSLPSTHHKLPSLARTLFSICL